MSRYGQLMECIARSSLQRIREILNDPTINVRQLVNMENQAKQTPIFQVCVHANEQFAEEVVDLLLQKGANPLHEDGNKQNVLYFLARDGKDRILKKLLEKYSFDLNKDDYIRQTPLFWSASKNHKNASDLLIRHGADVNKLDHNEQTPIYYAASFGFLEMCKLLVNRGADYQITDKNRETPSHYAKKNKHRHIMEYFNSLKATNQKIKQKQRENSRFQESSHQESKAQNRKKKQLNKSEYYFVHTNQSGQIHQLSSEELDQFARTTYQCRTILELLKNPEKLDLEPVPEEKRFQKICNKILKHFDKHTHAIHFAEPVDYVALNIPNYPQIITKPMDLSTIRTKLSFNCYSGGEQFAADMHLIFDNCVTFNGKDSIYGKMATEMKSEFGGMFKREFGL